MITTNATARPKQNLIARYPLASFFSLAIGLGWLAILPALAWGVPFKPFQTAGAYAPLLAGLIVSAAAGNEALKAFWARLTHFRFGIGWYLFALLFYVGLYMVMAGLSGAPVIQSLTEKWTLIITVYLPAVVTTHLVNAFGEEAGWTGFAQDRLQKKYNPTMGAILLGVLWAAWHLPAYFVPSEMGAFNPVGFVVFILQCAFIRIIWTWAVNKAHGSVVFAALLHASSNAVSFALIPQLLPAPTPEQMALSGMILLGMLLVTAVGLVVVTRGKLGYKKQNYPG